MFETATAAKIAKQIIKRHIGLPGREANSDYSFFGRIQALKFRTERYKIHGNDRMLRVRRRLRTQPQKTMSGDGVRSGERKSFLRRAVAPFPGQPAEVP